MESTDHLKDNEKQRLIENISLDAYNSLMEEVIINGVDLAETLEQHIKGLVLFLNMLKSSDEVISLLDELSKKTDSLNMSE